MYKILLKMKKIYRHEDWLKMVEQAKSRGKLTDDEFRKLMELDKQEEQVEETDPNE